PRTVDRVVEDTPVLTERVLAIDTVTTGEVHTANGTLGVVDRALDEADARNRVTNLEGFRTLLRRVVERRSWVVTEDGVARCGVQRGAAHAVGGNRSGTDGGDHVGDLDLVVIQNEAEVRDEARLKNRRE